jgi:hypothetical protein
MREVNMPTSNSYDWNDNTFWGNIVERKHRIEKATLSGLPCRSVPQTSGPCAEIWSQDSVKTGSTLPALLQNPHVVVDATDRGLGIYPLRLGGRYFLRPSFTIEQGSSLWNTHPQADINPTPDGVERKFLLAPGAGILTGTAPDGVSFEVRTFLPESFPFVLVELTLRNIRNGQILTVTPELLWEPGVQSSDPSGKWIWLQPRQAPVFDEVVCRNNSSAADPQRPDLDTLAGIGVALEGPVGSCPVGGVDCVERTLLTGQAPLVVCDQVFRREEFGRVVLTGTCAPETARELHLTLILGICATPSDFSAQLERWRQLTERDRKQETEYWAEIAGRVRFTCPSPAVNRQVPYSVHNSLFSRSVTDQGRTLFIHGRRDRGYGDCSKIHQSYQMHLPALAAGEDQSVRSELLAYAALQDARGDLARQPRPGSGWHPYIGLYSTANYLLALYRYLCWTGDTSVLDEPVASLVEPGSLQTVFARMLRGADWLLANRWEGVVAPCGWVDAWPVGVKSQSQISIATFMALDRVAQICAYQDRAEEALRYRAAAEALRARILDVFYTSETGLFAEYLFEDGTVAGGREDDFWSVTQIWAALAGLAPDTRGLDLCRKYCLKSGMTMYPETVLRAPYMLKFTDDMDALPVHAVATYGLAAWPELTHLYALAETRYRRPDLALNALERQLPETIHALNPVSSPTYYAEKYLYPYNEPWQCTWGGDPTFIQLLLEGFMGIQAGLDGLVIEPRLPKAWKDGGPLQAHFSFRGEPYKLTVDPNLTVPSNWTLTITTNEKE